ncbi:hypothetical protein MANES_14G067750v8 [Manihot esculenta]|uniref:Uncharacterized protein n=1 Tax=Manihot esculenta TaxID=3983 RepID=A0ACB7GER9_MANES|nr:hypothetical protein MANES_14G067750v8 [Manihot esculenta]
MPNIQLRRHTKSDQAQYKYTISGYIIFNTNTEFHMFQEYK